jgi:GlpG protein
MRQVGSLNTEREARRFAAWLVAQRIEAHAEQEPSGWVVWVRDEDKLPEAREALAHFREHPDDAKYQGAEQSAQAVLRDEEARRKQAQGNVVEMRGRWGAPVPGMSGAPRRALLVKLLIGISAAVALLAFNDTINSDAHQGPPGQLYRSLLFVDPAAARSDAGQVDMWGSIRRGEVWRLLTPIFIHYDWMHIIFNVMMLYSFGSVIEDRRGTAFMIVLVLALAAFSNAGQAIEATVRSQPSFFGGLSGVVYGLFGYLYIKSKFDSRERYFLHPVTTFIATLWLVLCILADVPPFSGFLGALQNVANSAHVVGLIMGAAIAYVPLLVRKAA